KLARGWRGKLFDSLKHSMSSSINTTSSRSFIKNKYVEYRRMYDEARNFSKTLDNAQSSSTPTPSKSDTSAKPNTSTKPDTSSDLATTDSHPRTKGLARRSGDSPFGVKPKDLSSPDTSTTSNTSSSPDATGGTADYSAVTSNANVNVPNTGAASDRMVDKIREFEPYIRAAADRYGLPPELIAGVIWQESRGNPRAVSHCGAMGLMQLMPATAASLGASNAF